ncbi:hypothetical protein E2C01_024475 [Portunus trituberculatus]|uniref:Uncharacterized protein n=1 Tax=Portunus trituberculatus TaxID=210409 RepID=A0A5B7EDW7_PORTR|nr:hypothetical protein [Portunus trituberculatus]
MWSTSLTFHYTAACHLQWLSTPSQHCTLHSKVPSNSSPIKAPFTSPSNNVAGVWILARDTPQQGAQVKRGMVRFK